jgi:hypothetical protein
MQDIVPNGHRSIRSIPLPTHRPKTVARAAKPVEEEDVLAAQEEEVEGRREAIKSAREEFEQAQAPRRSRRAPIGKKPFVIGGIVMALLAVILVLSTVFHGATVTVTPRTQAVSFKNDLSAVKSSTTGGLSFQAKVIKQTGSVQLKATGEKQVNTQASGVIVIYNNYSATSQRLVKNTRFETPEGLIFRVNDSVTVPGKKGTVPGTVEAVVVADEAGDKYNAGLKDFTIPGFKGDPRFSAFYAKSKPSKPLAGGFSGTVKIVAEADLIKAQADIKTKATVELLKQADAQVPQGSVFFPSASVISCSSLPQENVSSSEVLVKMECTLSAAFFDTMALSSKLAQIKADGYNGEAILVRGIDALTFVPRDGFDPAAESLSFTIEGDSTFEWAYDETTFRQKLVGTKKSQMASIIQAFPTIEKATASIMPPWLGTFPKDAKDITVKKAF